MLDWCPGKNVATVAAKGNFSGGQIMRKTMLPWCILISTVLLVACGGDRAAEDPEGVVPEHQLKALDKAENVDNVLEEADKARRAATDD